MKQGYGVFGAAYEVMLRNDPHDPRSIDHELLRRMVRLDPESYDLLYAEPPFCPHMEGHDLYGLAQTLKKQEDRASIETILAFTSGIAKKCETSLEKKRFGGTEQEILARGTDWCTDMARVAVVLLGCIGIPARVLYLADPERAYHGHSAVEAFYDGKYGAADPIYGYTFYNGGPLDAYTLMHEPQHLKHLPEEYRSLFQCIAVSRYDPMDPSNDYSVSAVNAYYRTVLTREHHGHWMMGEG